MSSLTLFEKFGPFTPAVSCTVEAGKFGTAAGTVLRCSAFEISAVTTFPAGNSRPELGVALRGAPRSRAAAAGAWACAATPTRRRPRCRTISLCPSCRTTATPAGGTSPTSPTSIRSSSPPATTACCTGPAPTRSCSRRRRSPPRPRVPGRRPACSSRNCRLRSPAGSRTRARPTSATWPRSSTRPACSPSCPPRCRSWKRTSCRRSTRSPRASSTRRPTRFLLTRRATRSRRRSPISA